MIVSPFAGDVEVDKPVAKPGQVIVVYAKNRKIVYWKANGERDWKPLGIDPRTGKARIPVVAGVKWITISDREYPDPSGVGVEIIEDN